MANDEFSGKLSHIICPGYLGIILRVGLQRPVGRRDWQKALFNVSSINEENIVFQRHCLVSYFHFKRFARFIICKKEKNFQHDNLDFLPNHFQQTLFIRLYMVVSIIFCVLEKTALFSIKCLMSQFEWRVFVLINEVVNCLRRNCLNAD